MKEVLNYERSEQSDMYNEGINQDKLIKHLYTILNAESNKHYSIMDVDLIDACTELILEIQGKNFTLSNEELEEKVRKIPFIDTNEMNVIIENKTKKLKKKKILLIAAIIAIICTLLATIGFGTGFDKLDIWLTEKFGNIQNVPDGETYTLGNEEFVNVGNYASYYSTDEFSKNEDYDVLLPSKTLPEGIELKEISVLYEMNTIEFIFNESITCYTIKLNSDIPQAEKDIIKTVVEVNGITCYVENIENTSITQIRFTYKNNYYIIGGTDKQILLDLIENLEEKQ